MAEPGHSLNKAPEGEKPRAVKPAGDGLWTRARAGLDRRLCGLSQKLSLASALLLCATPLLLVHAGPPSTPAPDRVAGSEPRPMSSPTPPETPQPTPAIEIVRTRPVTAAAPTTPQVPASPAAKAAPLPSPTPPAASPSPTQATPSPASPPPVAPATWSEAELTAARQQCGVLLAPLQVTAQELPPLRQDKCGTPAPMALKRLGPATGGIELSPPAVLNCNMVVQLSTFVEKTLQPAAREAFGSPVVRFNQASGYVCRGRNGDLMANGKLSEHALANALDVASFTLADGRVIDVGKHWGPAARDFKNTPPAAVAHAAPGTKGAPIPPQGNERSGLGAPVTAPAPAKAVMPDPAATRTKEALFLRRLHQGACTQFGTVLGPEANEAHREHFHFDLHPRRHTSYCQ